MSKNYIPVVEYTKGCDNSEYFRIMKLVSRKRISSGKLYNLTTICPEEVENYKPMYRGGRPRGTKNKPKNENK